MSTPSSSPLSAMQLMLLEDLYMSTTDDSSNDEVTVPTSPVYTIQEVRDVHFHLTDDSDDDEFDLAAHDRWTKRRLEYFNVDLDDSSNEQPCTSRQDRRRRPCKQPHVDEPIVISSDEELPAFMPLTTSSPIRVSSANSFDDSHDK